MHCSSNFFYNIQMNRIKKYHGTIHAAICITKCSIISVRNVFEIADKSIQLINNINSPVEVLSCLSPPPSYLIWICAYLDYWVFGDTNFPRFLAYIQMSNAHWASYLIDICSMNQQYKTPNNVFIRIIAHREGGASAMHCNGWVGTIPWPK